MNDEQILLANAYVDGELSEAQRRAAESDAAVMAEVVKIRRLLDELDHVRSVDDGTRNAAIAAAISAAPSRRRTRPRSIERWGYVAAAVVTVGLVTAVLVAVRAVGGDGRVADQAADAVMPVSSMSAPDEAAAGSTSTTSMASVAETATTVAKQDSRRTTPVRTTVPISITTPDSIAPPANDRSAPGIADLDEPFRDTDELAAIGDQLIDMRDQRSLPPTPEFACDPVDPINDSFIEILSKGRFFDGGRDRPVLIGVSSDDATVYAIDPNTCNVLLRSENRYSRGDAG